jgi:hypothetical protein
MSKSHERNAADSCVICQSNIRIRPTSNHFHFLLTCTSLAATHYHDIITTTRASERRRLYHVTGTDARTAFIARLTISAEYSFALPQRALPTASPPRYLSAGTCRDRRTTSIRDHRVELLFAYLRHARTSRCRRCGNAPTLFGGRLDSRAPYTI